jgi:hypothetical protein
LDEAARQEAAEATARELRKAGRKPYIIGNPVLGAVGYVVAAEELLRQASETVGNFDHIVIPGSMGPTEAGILYGLLRGGFTGQVHVISVEYLQRVSISPESRHRLHDPVSTQISEIRRSREHVLWRQRRHSLLVCTPVQKLQCGGVINTLHAKSPWGLMHPQTSRAAAIQEMPMRERSARRALRCPTWSERRATGTRHGCPAATGARNAVSRIALLRAAGAAVSR